MYGERDLGSPSPNSKGVKDLCRINSRVWGHSLVASITKNGVVVLTYRNIFIMGIKSLAMQEFKNLETAYLYFLEKFRNPRLSLTNFFKIQTAYKSENGLNSFILDTYNQKILMKPEIFCNSGLAVNLMKNSENQLELLKECRRDSRCTYAIALCGHWSFLKVKNGASDIKFVDRVIPTYPSDISPFEITFSEKGKLKEDLYPHGWDEIDWEVYYLMKDPSISFTKAIRDSEKNGSRLSRPTIRKRFKKILKDCKIQMNFFPRGYRGYDQVCFTFRTKYEIGLHNALKKIDRTSYLWKVRDFIILILFVEHYCATVRHFKEMEENGLIRNLTVSIPNRHYSSYEESSY